MERPKEGNGLAVYVYEQGMSSAGGEKGEEGTALKT